MVKRVILATLIFATFSTAGEPTEKLQKSCLACHVKQKIPSELLYRRYLLKYSSRESIEVELFNFLRDPKKENSIMPKQFFLKFPEKKTLSLTESALKSSIEEYLDYFEIRKRLTLK